jgi:hypothetical protein
MGSNGELSMELVIQMSPMSTREARKFRAAMRELKAKKKGSGNAGGVLIARSKPYQNRKRYNRAVMKRQEF